MDFEKTVLQEGSGVYCPNKLAKVVVDVTGKWSTSDGGDTIFDHRENAVIDLGGLYLGYFALSHLFSSDQANDELSQAVEDMICTMKQSERAVFSLESGCKLLTRSLSLNEGHRHPPDGAEVVYTIQLHSFERGKDVWELTDQERLDVAKKHKEEGSKLFKQNHVHQAAIRYSKAIQYLAAVDPDIPLEVEDLEDYEKEIVSLRTVSLLNLAACQLKLQQYDHVVRNCSRVLEVEPGNVKSLYRRARALLAMKDYESARNDAEKAKGLDPGNQAVGELLRAVDIQESAHRAKYKDALKAMFN